MDDSWKKRVVLCLVCCEMVRHDEHFHAPHEHHDAISMRSLEAQVQSTTASGFSMSWF